MRRKAIPEKIKKKLYQEAAMLCPMCGETDVSTFEIHHIQPHSEVGEHSEENMILLCSNCHSKITAGDFKQSEIFLLKISLIKGKHPYIDRKERKDTNNIINLNNSENSGIIANNVEINAKNKVVRFNAPKETIASSLTHRSYIKRLIDRYHDFKKAEIGKKKMSYGVFYGAINRKFKAKWDMIPLVKFEELSLFIQERIDKTILGKNKKAKNIKCYSSYEEFLEKYIK